MLFLFQETIEIDWVIIRVDFYTVDKVNTDCIYSTYNYTYPESLQKAAYAIMAFVNQWILWNTKESSVAKAGIATIVAANLEHGIKTKLGCQLKLEYPNQTLKFPLPNRWCSPDPTIAKQEPYMLVKVLGTNIKAVGQKQVDEVDQDPDRSRGVLHTMSLMETLHQGQIDNISLIGEKFSALSEVTYIPERELLFADSLVNGQVSYMLRKYGVNFYEIPQSKAIDEDYRKSFEKALKEQVWSDNSSKFGLTREDIIRRVSQNDGVYTVLFEHLEKISGGDVIQNMPELFCDNRVINEMHYMHVPYPIFLKVKTDAGFGFICIAVGVRMKKKVKIFSPFFASQGERVWRLVQSHTLSAINNDYSVRTHLGIYHFTTNQYHVPIYRCMEQLKDKQEKKNFQNFVDHCYGLFSRGLEGVNVTATGTLLSPVAKYSLVNKVFNLSQENALNLIAETSNNLKIYDYTPRSIVKNNGISDKEVAENFPKLNFDFQLYEILSEYVEGLYKAFNIGEIEDRLFAEINKQTKHMGVGDGSTPRPELRNKKDVLSTLKNLCFTWVGFHSHTFSIISFGVYSLFRPSMLKRRIPENPSEWENIQVCDELPDTKALLETEKLSEGTTQRDSKNFLMDQIKRQAEFSGYYANHTANKQLCQGYASFEKVAKKTYSDLRAYEERIIAVNRERKAQKNSLTFEWMIPSKIQTSLNI